MCQSLNLLKELSMRGVFLFVAGILVGTAIQTTGAQGPASHLPVRLNHVAISVPDVAQALTWYGEKLGIHEVVRNTNAQGQLMSAYIQVSRDTFIELQQANAQRPVGLNHFGFETTDIKGTVATLRKRGLTVSDPGAPSAFTGGILANITEPNAGRIELSEQPPEGKLRKATESWR
jgi:catechol 2,3-dioxygenase-like lactoylglutathione lyase family enzyme